MESLTYMSEEGIAAVCEANDKRADTAGRDGRQYDISLSGEDFRNLIVALSFVYENAVQEFSEEQATNDPSEWAGNFVSSIGTTLGVEFI